MKKENKPARRGEERIGGVLAVVEGNGAVVLSAENERK